MHRMAVSPIVAPANLLRFEALIRERTRKLFDELPVGETFSWVDPRPSNPDHDDALPPCSIFPGGLAQLTRWSDDRHHPAGLSLVDSWEQHRGN